MTVAEAGRMGGEKTAETHGSEFYSEIGSKGGSSEQGSMKEHWKQEEKQSSRSRS